MSGFCIIAREIKALFHHCIIIVESFYRQIQEGRLPALSGQQFILIFSYIFKTDMPLSIEHIIYRPWHIIPALFQV